MQSPQTSLTELWNHAWDLIIRGKNDPKHPFNLAVLSSSSSTSHLRSRTLVLRKALKESGQLWCYTDRRSAKAIHLSEGGSQMAWTFWNPKTRLQVTAIGKTDWLAEEETRSIFRSLPKHSRKAYATTLPPGTPQPEWADGLPKNWDELDLAETDYALENFGILVTTLTELDILLLGRDGHRRMKAQRSTLQSPWSFSWLIP